MTRRQNPLKNVLSKRDVGSITQGQENVRNLWDVEAMEIFFQEGYFAK